MEKKRSKNECEKMDRIINYEGAKRTRTAFYETKRQMRKGMLSFSIRNKPLENDASRGRRREAGRRRMAEAEKGIKSLKKANVIVKSNDWGRPSGRRWMV